MRYRVRRDLGGGQQPGDLVDLPDDLARALLQVGAIERMDAPAEPKAKTKPDYLRRDLVAPRK